MDGKRTVDRGTRWMDKMAQGGGRVSNFRLDGPVFVSIFATRRVPNFRPVRLTQFSSRYVDQFFQLAARFSMSQNGTIFGSICPFFRIAYADSAVSLKPISIGAFIDF